MSILYLFIAALCLVAAKAQHIETHEHNIYLITVAVACYFLAGCHIIGVALKQRKDKE